MQRTGLPRPLQLRFGNISAGLDIARRGSRFAAVESGRVALSGLPLKFFPLDEPVIKISFETDPHCQQKRQQGEYGERGKNAGHATLRLSASKEIKPVVLLHALKRRSTEIATIISGWLQIDKSHAQLISKNLR